MSIKQRMVYVINGGINQKFNIKIIFIFKDIIGGYIESLIYRFWYMLRNLEIVLF